MAARKLTVIVRVEVEADDGVCVAPLVALSLADFAAREDVKNGTLPPTVQTRLQGEGVEVRLAAAWNVERQDATPTGDVVHIKHPPTVH